VQWKKAEDAFDTAVTAGENAVAATMGDQTTVVQAAITTVQNSYSALQAIAKQYSPAVVQRTS
jgi:hypothetical protein